MENNPYQPPDESPSRAPPPGVRAAIGGFVFIVGAVVFLYGATAFWLIRGLPPNDAHTRLPSLYVLFAGMGVSLVGLVIRNLRLK